MNVEIRHLRSFIVLADELNFTRAARRLHISQPSLTRAMVGLERGMGIKLLHRTTRSVRLTAEGERLRAGAERVLREFDDILDTGAAPPPLRLGFTWLLPEVWAQQVIDRFEEDTGVRVTVVRRDDTFAGVDRGETDVAVLRGQLADHHLQAIRLFCEDRVVAVRRSDPLAGRRRILWDEMAGWPLVENTVSGTTHVDQWPPRLRPEVTAEATNFDEWLEAVAAGRGLGVVPRSAAFRVAHPAVRFVPLVGAPPVPVQLLLPRQGAHPFARQFVAAATLTDIPPHANLLREIGAAPVEPAGWAGVATDG